MMNIEWYWGLLIVVVGVVVGLLLITLLLASIFTPEKLADSLMREPKRRSTRQKAANAARDSGIPDPPVKYCSDCGSRLDWRYVKASPQGHDNATGVPFYRIFGFYECPNGHHAGAPSNGMVWLTKWKTTASWAWAL